MKKPNRHAFWTCCAAALFLSFGLGVNALADDSGSVHRPLFDDESTIAVTIEGPLNMLMRNRDELEELPGTLKYVDADGTERTLDIQLRVRGKYRAKKDICNFAPLRVNFEKKQVEGTVFAGQNTIKLVTDCQSSKSAFQQILLKEYLVYKIQNRLTDRSLGARLLRVTYIDADRNGKSRESYAFFIEEKEHVADRLGMELIKIPRIKYSELDAVQTNFVNVYEYFIANTDYSLVLGPADSDCCHNAILYRKANEPYISIPYDFDHAGLVDAPYAGPNPKFKITKVTQRLYRGRCENNVHLASTIQRFVDKRDEITQLVQGLDGFDERSVKGTLSFIDGFYKDAADSSSIDKKFVKKCS
jgi:hypothetical protein